MIAGLHLKIGLALIAVSVFPASASAADPKVPPGKHPGGTIVVLLSTGLDYTKPEIANSLARDGEGELVGWDFADGDRTPYPASLEGALPAWGGDGTAIATALLTNAEPGTLALAPVRISPFDPTTLAKAVAAASHMSAALVVVPAATADRAPWAAFEWAARQFKDVKIAVPACASDGAPRYPRDLKLANVMSTEDAIAAATSPIIAKAVTTALTNSCGG